ncbi:toll/interleukin-1 receptor domain-containing protein [Luteibacter aegosomatissinici]|uniref:toll/interleukin-1 receptor domain-containing protein n=1 Tax=Luteibacter aegosomatissinici TaxID=2911539 RepID=UPI001FFB46EC|nr:toll/interleukin-1 receptor domain-containing protein [Luteibacter aegosomatissinici]UPG94307.1 toll/interleukin-1 receptor domain-containing protein [Luteibacter aegosomatissinici]
MATAKKATAKQSAVTRTKKPKGPTTPRFEPVKLDDLFVALDAIAWLDSPNITQVAQFAAVDRRVAGKLLKNASQIGLAEQVGGGYVLSLPYPFKGSKEQKEAVVREALVKHPLLVRVRQFIQLGDKTEVALRKAATMLDIIPFSANDFAPLMAWAQALGAMKANLIAEDLVDAAEKEKEERHTEHSAKRIAFISHSSLDKPFIRQLAADLTARGIDVWLDEQRIRVGDSIPEKIAQGLAGSDYFLLAISENSAESEWVRKELNNALVSEVQRRKVHILPLKLDATPVPAVIGDKKYADFSKSYKSGLEELVTAMRNDA